MPESDSSCESDDDSWGFSFGSGSNLSEFSSITSDDDMPIPSLSTSSGGSSSSSSVGPEQSISEDDEMMDLEEDDDTSDTSDTSTPLDETEYEIDELDDDDVIVLSDGEDLVVMSDGEDLVVMSDGEDIADPNMDTVARSQPPPTFSEPAPMYVQEETVTRFQPSPPFNGPMSMLSAFSSKTTTCTEEATAPASCSSESNGDDNSSSFSIKNFLPPCLSNHKLVFDNGVEVDRILGAVVHNTQLLFRIRWRNDKNGGTDYVDAYEMHERCPHMALQYYNEHYKNRIINTDKTDK